MAFEAVSGKARLNSSMGFPAISARRAAKLGMLQCRHRLTQCLNVFFLHYVGNLRRGKEVPVRFGTNLTATALTCAKNIPEPSVR